MSTIDRDVLRRMPKVELHCHLEGSVRASTLIEMAQRRSVPLPTADPDDLYRFDDLAEFLHVYELACRALASVSDFALVTYEALEDAARSSNVRYREMFFNPSLHTVPYPAMLEGIVAGVRAAEHDYGIQCRLIPSIYRHDSVATATAMVEQVAAHRSDYVVGIGMDGDELARPTRPVRRTVRGRAVGRVSTVPPTSPTTGRQHSSRPASTCSVVNGSTTATTSSTIRCSSSACARAVSHSSVQRRRPRCAGGRTCSTRVRFGA